MSMFMIFFIKCKKNKNKIPIEYTLQKDIKVNCSQRCNKICWALAMA